MWELDNKYDWAPKNCCFQILVLEKTLESHLDCKEVRPINPKRNQPWIFIERTIAKAEAPILWPPDVKNWLIGKDPDAGKDWRQEKGITEDEMVGWHHRLDRHEFDGQGSLACYSLWGHKEKSWTQLSYWTYWQPQFINLSKDRNVLSQKSLIFLNLKRRKGASPSLVSWLSKWAWEL